MINISAMTVSGIDIAPTRRSATAMLDNSLVDVLFSSRFRCTARITSKFKQMTAREATIEMGSKIQCTVVSFKFHVKSDTSGQWITDLELAEAVFLVSLPFRAMLVWNLWVWTPSERRFNSRQCCSLWSGNGNRQDCFHVECFYDARRFVCTGEVHCLVSVTRQGYFNEAVIKETGTGKRISTERKALNQCVDYTLKGDQK